MNNSRLIIWLTIWNSFRPIFLHFQHILLVVYSLHVCVASLHDSFRALLAWHSLSKAKAISESKIIYFSWCISCQVDSDRPSSIEYRLPNSKVSKEGTCHIHWIGSCIVLDVLEQVARCKSSIACKTGYSIQLLWA